VKKIFSIDVAIYLMMQGVCDFDNDTFWSKFHENACSGYYIENVNDDMLRFLYDKSDCIACLNVKLVYASDLHSNKSRQLTLKLQEYPQKLCDDCRGLKDEKLKNL
jgi:hypothetical protein